MRAWGLLLFAACSYRSPQGGNGPNNEPDAASPVDTAVVDDAAIDSPPPIGVTTDHPSNADSFVSLLNTNTNFNDQTSALSDLDGRVALFRFDLASIPTNATIEAAELRIWSDDDFGLTCDFFQVLESWDEATVTWNSRAAGMAWSTAGVEPPSRGTTSFATVVGSSPNTEYVLPIDPALITTWVTNPGSNFGFAIISSSTDGTRFSTREHPTAAQRPILRVTHTP